MSSIWFHQAKGGPASFPVALVQAKAATTTHTCLSPDFISLARWPDPCTPPNRSLLRMPSAPPKPAIGPARFHFVRSPDLGRDMANEASGGAEASPAKPSSAPQRVGAAPGCEQMRGPEHAGQKRGPGKGPQAHAACGQGEAGARRRPQQMLRG